MIFFICVPELNPQWNSWICKLIGYLKVSIGKFEHSFENA